MNDKEFINRLNDLSGNIWLGEVIEHVDPRAEGRIKVRVFGKFDEIEDENLPWAYHLSSINGGSTGGWGEISIPKRGQIIQVIFTNNDILSPYWISFPKINESLRQEIQNDYEDAKVLVYDEDAKLKIMYLKGTGLIIHLDSSEVVIGINNNIKIEHKDTESIVELINNKVNIVSGAEINVVSNTVNVAGGQTNLGTNPIYSDTMAEPLMDLLTKLAALIDAKWPVSGAAAQALVEASKSFIISNTVKTTLL